MVSWANLLSLSRQKLQLDGPGRYSDEDDEYSGESGVYGGRTAHTPCSHCRSSLTAPISTFRLPLVRKISIFQNTPARTSFVPHPTITSTVLIRIPVPPSPVRKI